MDVKKDILCVKPLHCIRHSLWEIVIMEQLRLYVAGFREDLQGVKMFSADILSRKKSLFHGVVYYLKLNF